MKPKPKLKRKASKDLKNALTSADRGKYALRLYVAGATDRSRLALLRVREFCESVLKGGCTLEVIDVYQQPMLARDGQIIATPTLVKASPPPARRIIGNLADISRLFPELDLTPKRNPAI